MPVPVNITPFDAIDITGPVFTTAVSDADLTLTPTGSGYPSTCDANQRRALWYRYTPSIGENVFSISVGPSPAVGPNYNPTVSLWVGSVNVVTRVASLQQYRITGSNESSNLCYTLNNEWLQVPCQPGQHYWIQVTDSNATLPLNGGLTLTLRSGPVQVVPVGSLMVPDDATLYPTSFVSTAGSFLRYLYDVPPGEAADWVSTGEWCVHDGVSRLGVRFLDAAFGLVTTWTAPNSSIVLTIKANHHNPNARFFVTYEDGGTVYLQSFTKAGELSTRWTLPANAVNAVVVAVDVDEEVFYYAVRTANEPIHAFDLVNNVALPDLAAGTPLVEPEAYSDGFVAADGSIFIGFDVEATSLSPEIRRYDPAGVLLQTYTLTTGAFVNLNHYAESPDGTTFWAWGLPSPNTRYGIFHQIRISDGAVLTQLNVPRLNASGTNGPDPFNISNSCPLCLTPVALAVPVRTTVNEPIRVLRRFPLPVDRSFFLYISRLELIIQSGVGTVSGQGEDPLIQIRFSPDGGKTWGSWIQLPMGRRGEYGVRPVVNRIGKVRNGLCEVVISDPVFAYLLDCLIDVDESVL